MLLADTWLHSLAQPVNTEMGTATQVGQLQEKWQAHAKTARLGRDRCTVLRHVLMLNEEPAAVEASSAKGLQSSSEVRR